MNINSDNPERTRFLATDYVREPGRGPLFITEVDHTSVSVVSVLFGAEEIRSKVCAGATVQAVVDQTKTFQRSVVRFPVSALREVSWFEARGDVVVRYEDNGRRKKAITVINRSEDKSRLLECLQSKLARPFRSERTRAGILRVAWSHILGATVSMGGTLWLYTTWDPVLVAQVRHGGWLALAIGREGCAIVGAAFFLACCVCGWLAVRKHHWRYRYLVQ
jgi:hypothetical protein